MTVTDHRWRKSKKAKRKRHAFPRPYRSMQEKKRERWAINGYGNLTVVLKSLECFYVSNSYVLLNSKGTTFNSVVNS